MASKKQEKKDIRSGKIYRCLHCDVRCDDTYTSARYIMGEAVYLGRLDKSKSTIKHYCSRSCQDHVYLREILPKIQTLLECYEPAVDQIKAEYRQTVQDTPENKSMLSMILQCMKLFHHISKFLRACCERQNVYLLTELRFKALHTTATPLEDLREDMECVDLILKCRYFIEHLNLEVIGK